MHGFGAHGRYSTEVGLGAEMRDGFKELWILALDFVTEL